MLKCERRLSPTHDATDLTDAQWAASMPLVTVTPPKSGCSTEIDVRAIVNALLYKIYKNGACFRRMFR
jgi:transposase